MSHEINDFDLDYKFRLVDYLFLIENSIKRRLISEL